PLRQCPRACRGSPAVSGRGTDSSAAGGADRTVVALVSAQSRGSEFDGSADTGPLDGLRRSYLEMAGCGTAEEHRADRAWTRRRANGTGTPPALCFGPERGPAGLGGGQPRTGAATPGKTTAPGRRGRPPRFRMALPLAAVSGWQSAYV